MAFINNALNFPNLTAKTSPVLDDIVLISDGAMKQSTIEKIPDAPVAACRINTVNGYVVAAMPGYFTNTTTNSIAQSLALNSNIYFVPFAVNSAFTLNALAIYVITGVAASTANLAIYNTQASGLSLFPGNPLTIATASTATSSNQSAGIPSAFTLKPKTLYWAALQLSNASVSVQAVKINLTCNGSVSILPGIGASPQNIIYPNVFSPGVFPNVSVGSIAGGGLYAPLISFV